MENMEAFLEKFRALGERYNFPVISEDGKEILTAKNTDGKAINWIKYNPLTDVVSCSGNTDNLNIWLYETRKDLTPERVIQFINDLNVLFDLQGEDRFMVKELIDPEDWQEIAGIQDASEDSRYNL